MTYKRSSAHVSPRLSSHNRRGTAVKPPRRLIFHMIQTWRQRWADFADSPAALSINNDAAPLTPPPHASPPLSCHA